MYKINVYLMLSYMDNNIDYWCCGKTVSTKPEG